MASEATSRMRRRRRRRWNSDRIGYLILIFVLGVVVALGILSRLDARMNAILSRKVFRLERTGGVLALPLKYAFAVTGSATGEGLGRSIAERDLGRIRTLLDSGLSPNVEDATGRAPLRAALEIGSMEIARLLLARGADVNQLDRAGGFPLLSAVQRNDQLAVDELLGAGADVNRSSSNGTTPLLLAVSAENSPVIETLLMKHANVNLASADGRTPLLEAIKRGNSELVSRLIEAGANLNMKDKVGSNALIYAVRAKSIPILARLLTTDLSPMEKNQQGQSAYDIAKENDDEIFAFLSRIYPPQELERSPVEGALPNAPTLPSKESASRVVVSGYVDGSAATPKPSSTPQLMTRLRLVGSIEPFWKRGGALALQAVRLRVRNVGEYTAKDVAVQVRGPAGAMFPLQGPTVIERGTVAEYFAEVNVFVKREESLKADLRCLNCYR